jgi:hypothetical protein
MQEEKTSELRAKLDSTTVSPEDIYAELAHSTSSARVADEKLRLSMARKEMPWVRQWRTKNGSENYPIVQDWFIKLYIKWFGKELDPKSPRIHAIRILQQSNWELTHEIYLKCKELEDKEQHRKQVEQEIAKTVNHARYLSDNQDIARRAISLQAPGLRSKLNLFISSLNKMPPSMWQKIPELMAIKIQGFYPCAELAILPNGKPTMTVLDTESQLTKIREMISLKAIDQAKLYIKRFNEFNLTFTVQLCETEDGWVLEVNQDKSSSIN